jgi:hypothetical protein
MICHGSDVNRDKLSAAIQPVCLPLIKPLVFRHHSCLRVIRLMG